MPFHAAANWNHHYKSDWNSLLRRIWASLCLQDEDRMIILQTNDHPGLVTVVASVTLVYWDTLPQECHMGEGSPRIIPELPV